MGLVVEVTVVVVVEMVVVEVVVMVMVVMVVVVVEMVVVEVVVVVVVVIGVNCGRGLTIVLGNSVTYIFQEFGLTTTATSTTTTSTTATTTREIRKEYFQECPLCHSLQKSTKSIRDEEFTSLSFSDMLARHDGRVSKSDRTTIRVHGPRFTSRQ